MPVGGAFLGGVSERIPVGKCLLLLQSVTEDNANLSTAKWTISSTGRTYNVTADADGRAEQLVDSGFTYTITPTITGNYDGLTPQTVKADSTEAVVCQFDLRLPRAGSEVAVFEANGEGRWNVKNTLHPGDFIAVTLTGSITKPGESKMGYGTTVSCVCIDAYCLIDGPSVNREDAYVYITNDAKIEGVVDIRVTIKNGPKVSFRAGKITGIIIRRA